MANRDDSEGSEVHEGLHANHLNEPNQESPDLLNSQDLSMRSSPAVLNKTNLDLDSATKQQTEQEMARARAATFVTSCFNRFITSAYCTSYRHAVLLGKEWYTLLSVSVGRKPRSQLTMRFGGINTALAFDGSKDMIIRKIADLLLFGFCNDCGEQGSAAHRCKSLDVDVLNPPGDCLCSICQESCKMATRMPCGHAFHFSCLSTYYDSNFIAKCPNCRKRVKRSLWDNNYCFGFGAEVDDSDEETEDDSNM